MKRRCGGVTTSLRSFHERSATLITSASRMKPGNTRNSVARAMAAPAANGRPFFMKQMLATVATSQSMRRKAPPVHQ